MAAQVRAACPPAALARHAQCLAQPARRPAAASTSGSAWRQRQRRRRPVACPSSSSSRAAASPEAAALLDQFWLARGVVDEQQRRCGWRHPRVAGGPTGLPTHQPGCVDGPCSRAPTVLPSTSGPLPCDHKTTSNGSICPASSTFASLFWLQAAGGGCGCHPCGAGCRGV